jgi:hypothetical protein
MRSFIVPSQRLVIGVELAPAAEGVKAMLSAKTDERVVATARLLIGRAA